jgi:hypothetical protein
VIYLLYSILRPFGRQPQSLGERNEAQGFSFWKHNRRARAYPGFMFLLQAGYEETSRSGSTSSSLPLRRLRSSKSIASVLPFGRLDTRYLTAGIERNHNSLLADSSEKELGEIRRLAGCDLETLAFIQSFHINGNLTRQPNAAILHADDPRLRSVGPSSNTFFRQLR